MQSKIISGSDYPIMAMPIIENAKISIDIIVFDWRWYDKDTGAKCQIFNQTIARAAKRKIKIRAITNCEKLIRVLKNEGIDAKKLKTERLVHTKLMIIDKKIAITGSHNYTQSAFTKNIELSVIITGDEEMQKLNKYYENVWLK